MCHPKVRLGVVAFLFVTVFLLGACSAKTEKNPFEIGQVIYPATDFSQTHSTEEIELAKKGAVVVNLTSTLVRVRYQDNTEEALNFHWFVPSELKLTEKWVLGNPFHVGDAVCALPDSIRESFPDKGVVAEVAGDLLQLEGYSVPFGIHWAHFQHCP